MGHDVDDDGASVRPIPAWDRFVELSTKEVTDTEVQQMGLSDHDMRQRGFSLSAKGMWVRLAVMCMALLAMPALAISANGAQGGITAVNNSVSSGTADTGSTVALNLNPQFATVFQDGDQRYGTVGIQVTGTFTATLTFQGSQDEGATWVSFPVIVAPTPTSNATGSGVTTTTGTGNWIANVSGWTNFRVTCTSYTSGTATVTIERFRGQGLLTIQGSPSTGATASTGATTPTTATLAGTATTTSAPTYTTAQMNPLSTDTSGNLRTINQSIGATGSTAPTSATLAAGSDGTNARAVAVDQNGVTLESLPTGSAWSLTNTSAANGQATATKAAGASGVKHVATMFCGQIYGDSTGNADQATINLRDGGTGAGTVLASMRLNVATGANTVGTPFCIQGFWVGTAATAMTVEMSAAGATHTIGIVSATGYDTK